MPRRLPNEPGVMSPFQQMLEKDITGVFLNEREFGAHHTIDGARVLIVTDSDALRMAMEKADTVGTGEKVLYFAKVGTLPKRPIEGAPQVFDGRAAEITTCYEDNGMYEITLTLHRAGGAF